MVSFGTLPSGVTAGTDDAVTVMITDDDVPVVSFTATTATASESAGTVNVRVQLNISPAETLVIPVRTMDVTAAAGSDYMALTATNVTFAADTGTLTQTVPITITDDGIDEIDETFTVSLGTLPSGVTAGTPTSITVTITDEDVRK